MTKKKAETKTEVKKEKAAPKKTAPKKTTPKKSVAKKSAPKKSRPKRVVVDRDTEVIFMNNTNGVLFYKCPKTHVMFDMQQFGDEDYITVEQLLIMNNSSRKMLKELWVLLVDTVDENVDINDVIEYLGLNELYNDEVVPEDIDGFIIDSEDNRFEKSLKTMGDVLSRHIVERSIVLYRQGKLNSLSKISIIKDFADDEDLFE